MDKLLALQVLHRRGHLRSYVNPGDEVEDIMVAAPQIVEEVSLAHELCDDEEWRLTRAHACVVCGVWIHIV